MQRLVWGRTAFICFIGTEPLLGLENYAEIGNVLEMLVDVGGLGSNVP